MKKYMVVERFKPDCFDEVYRRFNEKRRMLPEGYYQMVFAHGVGHGQYFIGEQLFCASSVAIKRHVKIKGEATAYDPQWDAYFAMRKRKNSTVELPGPLLGC